MTPPPDESTAREGTTPSEHLADVINAVLQGGRIEWGGEWHGGWRAVSNDPSKAIAVIAARDASIRAESAATVARLREALDGCRRAATDTQNATTEMHYNGGADHAVIARYEDGTREVNRIVAAALAPTGPEPDADLRAEHAQLVRALRTWAKDREAMKWVHRGIPADAEQRRLLVLQEEATAYELMATLDRSALASRVGEQTTEGGTDV